MLRTIIELTFLLLAAGCGYAADQPDIIGRLPASGLMLLDITATRDGITAVGERGHILSSEDGKAWHQAEVPVNATLTAVYFHDEVHGWAVGHDAVILKTTDGGRHWRQVYHAPEAEAPLLDVWFADKDKGIAIGAYGMYLTTRDGGENWSREALSVVQQNPEVTGGGEHRVDTDDLHLNAIAASASGRLYIVAEGGHVYRSDDSGVTWLELPSPYAGSLFGVLALAQDELLVFGLRGHLYLSENAGDSWKQVETRSHDLLSGGVRLNDGTIMIAGMGGTVLVSRDQGRSFTRHESGHRHGLAAVAEHAGGITFAGEHGVETITRELLGIGNE